MISHMPEGDTTKKVVVMDSVVVKNPATDLGPVARTEARVFLLYATHEEARLILKEVMKRKNKKQKAARNLLINLRWQVGNCWRHGGTFFRCFLLSRNADMVWEANEKGAEFEFDISLGNVKIEFHLSIQAAALGLTGKAYVWIVTQSVVGSVDGDAPDEFPTGMLGVHFNTDRTTMIEQIKTAMTVLGQGGGRMDDR
jgi:hypothetical protein